MSNHINAFLTYLQSEMRASANTVAAYRNDLMQWANYATDGSPDNLHPHDVTYNDMRLWIASLGRTGVSTRTLRRKVQSLRAFYRFLMKQGMIMVNPAMNLQLAKTPPQLPVYVRPAETEALLDYEPDDDDFIGLRNKLILLTFYSTGIRTTELETMLDVNVDNNRRELKVLGKRSKERIIPYGDEMSEMIERYRNVRDDLLCGVRPERFFVRPTGEPMYRSLIYKIVHESMSVCVNASRRSPHVLRHSFATDMLNNGADINAVQRLMGHASLAATQIYTHVTLRELQNNYNRAHPRATKKGG
ncbi:MAG: tyrosine-type recombinase/integrase [Muribaculaceae bacterium]|nr:tyrosine-type recombinase/integrase [Muribaculaceae bacterium]